MKKKFFWIFLPLIIISIFFWWWRGWRGGTHGGTPYPKYLTAVRTDSLSNEEVTVGDNGVKLMEVRLTNNSSTADFIIMRAIFGVTDYNEYSPFGIKKMRIIRKPQDRQISETFTYELPSYGYRASTTLDLVLEPLTYADMEVYADIDGPTSGPGPEPMQISLFQIYAEESRTRVHETVWHDGQGGSLYSGNPIDGSVFKVSP